MFATLYFFLPFSAAGAFIANVIYLIVVTVGIRKGKLPLKRYALTINRTCADIFTILVGAYFYMKQKMERCDSHICLPVESGVSRYVLQVVFVLNYWCVSLSYSGIAVLTNYAVNLTSMKVAKYIVMGWMALLFCFFLCVLLVHQGELDYNSNSVIHLFLDDFDSDEYIGEWIVDLCQHINTHPGTRSLIVTILPPILFYLISVVSYVFIIHLLFSRRKVSSYHRHWGSMLRLGIHLILFAGTCALTGTAYLGSFSIGNFCEQHQKNEPMCLEAVVSYMWNTAAALIGWICRMVIDATVDTVDIACFFIIHSKISCHKTSTGPSRKSESVQMESLIKKPPSRTRRLKITAQKKATILEESIA
ncbi:Protein CBG18104 [Caenorhabditis briggsae]|uniref:Protein CBG18104 n=1 Tax=Caenorhabditis briggsae TaxID=6238 RepID=A8XT15_CAEBR|nr:Protein CBG18104 [Caenorhabditis briggsae]CAP35618.2 Protein CBG18104 [Caenorhabditis briggsae]